MGIVEIFNTVLYEPILNLLFFFVERVPGGDFGIAIILTTIIVRLILFIPSMSQIKSQKAMQDAQPKIDEIRKKYGGNREEMGRQLMKFYKENKINPMTACLPLLIQLPIIIALYRVFIGGLATDPETGFLVADQLAHLYEPLRATFTNVAIDGSFLGIVDLTMTGNAVIAALAAGFQFFQAKMLISKRPDNKTSKGNTKAMGQAMSRQMTMYMLPAITFIFAYRFPAGLGLYWIVSMLFSIGQQIFIFRRVKTPSSDAPHPQTTDQPPG